MELTRLDKLVIEEVSGVDDPASQLPGWMLTKARQRRIIEHAEGLRKALGSDDLFERVVKAALTPDELVFFGTQGIRILKAKHSHRVDGGGFAPQPAKVNPSAPLPVLRHGGSPMPVVSGCFRDRPAGGDPASGHAAYGEIEQGDPLNLRERADEWLNPHGRAPSRHGHPRRL